MSFTQEYQKKLTTADEAVKVVKSGDRLESVSYTHMTLPTKA